MLIVVLQSESVFGSDDPIEIGDGLMGEEIGRALRESIFGEIDRGNETVGGRDQKLTVGEFVIEQTIGDGADGAAGRAELSLDLGGSRKVARGSRAGTVDEGGQGCEAAVVGEAGRNGDARAANLGVGFLDVLIGKKTEELVLDERAAQRGTRGVAVKARHFVTGGNVG